MKVVLIILVVLVIIALLVGGSFVGRRNQMAITHEAEVFADIAKARQGYMNATTPADKIAANSQLEASLAKVLVLTENYPQLKSNENFLRLQDELAGTENRIAVERRRYNETVQDYNTYISLFPNSLVASF